MEVGHAAGVAIEGRGVGPVEPPVIPRIAIEGSRLFEMDGEARARERSLGPNDRAGADRRKHACRARGLGLEGGEEAQGGNDSQAKPTIAHAQSPLEQPPRQNQSLEGRYVRGKPPATMQAHGLCLPRHAT